MQGGKNQVAGQGSLNCDFSSFTVADLADQDNVRVLPNNGTETIGKSEVDLGVDLHLADALHLVLNGVLCRCL